LIAESQLDTWASQAATKQFTDTYNRIRENLLDTSAPYPLFHAEVFLQGSYKNDTNVYGDSDVDLVLYHTGAFYKDLTRLSPDDRRALSKRWGR
jgi:tRNA nucleotidyltransferase (CCA-adding enzyme)